MEGFRSSRGRITARVSPDEREFLLYLITELAAVVEPAPPDSSDPLAELVGISEATRPSDPAVLRLFPDAYSDPEQALEFRRYTEDGLRRAKSATLNVVRDSLVASGEKLVLSRQQAEAWVATLNDLRLLLGTRLGVTQDQDDWDRLDPGDPALVAYSTYEFLGWVQATLLHALYGVDA